jgi:hypothetical protein
VPRASVVPPSPPARPFLRNYSTVPLGIVSWNQRQVHHGRMIRWIHRAEEDQRS